MRTRWIWLTIAVAAVVAGAALLLVPTASRAGSQIAIITAINADGTVEWDEAQFVPSEDNNSIAEPIPDRHHQATLADQPKIFTAVGDWCAASGGPLVDKEGIGTKPCTRAEFLAITPNDLYAVRITLDDEGRISRIGEYYHP